MNIKVTKFTTISPVFCIHLVLTYVAIFMLSVRGLVVKGKLMVVGFVSCSERQESTTNVKVELAEGATIRERLSKTTTCLTEECVTGVGGVRIEVEQVAFMSGVLDVTPSVSTMVMEVEIALAAGVDSGFSVVARGVAS